MSTLQERLDRIKAGFVAQAPQEALDVMAAATDSLRDSGILERMPQVGSTLASFDLPDTEGQMVRSTELLPEGPLVVGFYRGVW